MPDIGKDSDFTRVEDRREGQEAHGKAVEKFMTTAPRVDQVISLQTKMRLAWTFSPPFKAEYSEAELTAMIDAINATAPDVLWVGLTAPKQENGFIKTGLASMWASPVRLMRCSIFILDASSARILFFRSWG